MDEKINAPYMRIDKTAISTATLFDKSDLKTYWHSRTPHERLQYIEILRRTNYGYNAASRLRRVLEIAERTQS